MVLSGTLREFILADVMQLLTQQKITGKLILINGSSEGYIVFRNGTIVSAVREQEQFSTKLFYFLTEMRQQPKNKMRELFASYEGNLAGLTSLIETRGLLTHEELENYAVNVTIDITCSLFLWNRGHYRFDSMPSVEHLIPAGIDIPVENVVMEAMRRVDEWHRMREAITGETIFSRTGKGINLETDHDPINDPSPYFYHRIDGTTDMRKLLADSFLTEYKIYETLYQMMQDDLIHPLSDSITRSIRAAILKKDQDQSVATIFSPIVAIFISLGIVVLIVLLVILLRGVLFSSLIDESSALRSRLARQETFNHLHEAELFYRCTCISSPYSEDQLPDFFSLTGNEVKYISEKRDLE